MPTTLTIPYRHNPAPKAREELLQNELPRAAGTVAVLALINGPACAWDALRQRQELGDRKEDTSDQLRSRAQTSVNSLWDSWGLPQDCAPIMTIVDVPGNLPSNEANRIWRDALKAELKLPDATQLPEDIMILHDGERLSEVPASILTDRMQRQLVRLQKEYPNSRINDRRLQSVIDKVFASANFFAGTAGGREIKINALSSHRLSPQHTIEDIALHEATHVRQHLTLAKIRSQYPEFDHLKREAINQRILRGDSPTLTSGAGFLGALSTENPSLTASERQTLADEMEQILTIDLPADPDIESRIAKTLALVRARRASGQSAPIDDDVIKYAKAQIFRYQTLLEGTLSHATDQFPVSSLQTMDDVPRDEAVRAISRYIDALDANLAVASVGSRVTMSISGRTETFNTYELCHNEAEARLCSANREISECQKALDNLGSNQTKRTRRLRERLLYLKTFKSYVEKGLALYEAVQALSSDPENVQLQHEAEIAKKEFEPLRRWKEAQDRSNTGARFAFAGQ
jgi:hypothetical protein